MPASCLWTQQMKPYNNLLKHFFILIFFFAISFANAQVLLPTPETAFNAQQHNFNPEVIKTRGIKKIVFEIVDKKDFEEVVDRNLTETYEFNENGFLSRYYYTTIAKTIVREKNYRGVTETYNQYVYDTISTAYFYAENKLILKRYHDGANYYEARYYHYDTLGNLTKELRYKETNNSSDKTVFMLGNQMLLSQDSCQWIVYGTKQRKCILLNNENRPYKENIINFDSAGRKTSVYENYVSASWIKQESKFEYNSKHLISAQFKGNANNSVILKNVYEYDEQNELYGEKQYRNDVLMKEISYVSTKDTNLLHSFVIRDHQNKTIRIVKLKYDFGMLSKE